MARTESGKQPLPEQRNARTPAATSAPLPAAALHQLQRSAGNAAVARLVAQRYTPPVKPPPAQAPGLRRVNADIGAKRQKLSAHPAPTAESRAAQDAAVAPPDDKQAQAKTQQAEKMNAAEPGDFDKAAFITAVNQAVEAQAPKNLDEADNFSDSGNADRIKDEVDGQVTDGAESSAEDIATTTGETPDTSQTTDKEVTPLTADQPPGNPGAPNASDAVPARQPDEVTDFSEGQRDTEQQMADADVTEEQLARGNEPDFDNALSEKKQGEEETAAAPGQARAAENAEIQTAKSGAAAAGAAAMAGLTATRQETGAQVDSGKTETKSADEKKREQVTAKLQKVFDDTKTDVEKTLDGLDDKVDTQFTNGEKRARDAFTADHERRMKAYKDKRYSGLRGKARWVKDKFAGLPDEANDLYQESRKLYVNRMQGVISDIADTIGRELGRAKSRIERGRTELQAEVEKLPADLRRFGEEAAADFSGQFDDLETTVDEKSEQLVQDLAQKYTEALDAIDEEIKELQEANKGLWDRIKDAVVGVIQTIIELTNALMGILAKAASAVSKIIKDPIGFLGNVVRFVGDGLNLFTANIEQHLKTGLVSWLLGTAVKTGLEIPAKFDAKGIVQLLGSLLGLTWDTIRAKIVRKGVPDKAMATVEKTIPEAQALQREGPAGLTKEITGESGDLKKTILDDLKSYLIPTVIVAGIAWIVSLLTPASAFVRAVKGIIDIVTFIVTQAAQITDFMNAILDAVIAIADGAAAGVPKLIESALSTSIPVLLGFLAALLGIGSLANKVRSVFQKVSRPVGRAIDKIIDRIAKSAKKIFGSLKGDKGLRSDRKKRELPLAKAKAQAIMSDNESRGDSVEATAADLHILKSQFSWIKGFRAAGKLGDHEIIMIASEHNLGKFQGPTEGNGELIKKIRGSLKFSEHLAKQVAMVERPNARPKLEKRLSLIRQSLDDLLIRAQSASSGHVISTLSSQRDDQQGLLARIGRDCNDAKTRYPKSWDSFDPSFHAEFESRLIRFRGKEDLEPTSGFRGGEGQLFLSPLKHPLLALKRWFRARVADMPQSIALLISARSAITSNPELGAEMDIVGVEDRGGDWIVRGFDPISIPLKDALQDPEVAAARRKAMESARGQSSARDILTKLEGNSANLHWSPRLGKILIIDMQ
ncbi:hypothetical protein ACWGIB_03415 [Streptomyces xiamenensis]